MTPHGAVTLAGFLQHEPIFVAGPLSLTLHELLDDPFVPLDVGRWTVQVVLPWGRWNTVVRVADGEKTLVGLPKTVGVPPLRVRALRSPRGDAAPDLEAGAPAMPARSVLTLTKGVVPTAATAYDGRATPPDLEGKFRGEPAPPPWRGVHWRATSNA